MYIHIIFILEIGVEKVIKQIISSLDPLLVLLMDDTGERVDLWLVNKDVDLSLVDKKVNL